MRYMLLIHHDENDLGDPDRLNEIYAGWAAFNAALAKAAGAAPGERMEPASKATTVRVRDGRTGIVDGPYSDTKEQLGGYFFIEAESLEKAVEWAELCPASKYGAVEIRPIVPPGRDY
jgi:Uncharacterized protein conserved in bacteria